MKPVKVYPESMRLPDGATEIVYAKDQPEYQPLPCVRLPSGEILTKWELDDDEREIVSANGAFYLCLSTFNQPLQPLMPMADEPAIAQDEQGRHYFYTPTRPTDDPDFGLPAGYRDAIYTDTQIHFGYWDRLKILFGWKVRLEAKTFTQRRPGRCFTESNIHVFRERPLPEGWGVVAAGEVRDGSNG
jgi:hypothetical protein